MKFKDQSERKYKGCSNYCRDLKTKTKNKNPPTNNPKK